MRLRDVALANLKVRKTKTVFLLLGIILALGAVTALYTVTSTLQLQLAQQMERLGVRFLVTPPVQERGFTYNGIPIGEQPAAQELTLPEEVLRQAKDVDLPELNALSAKLVLASEVRKTAVLLNGLDFEQELSLKGWWKVHAGQLPAKKREVLLGSKAAATTKLEVGDNILLLGEDFTVAGILAESGQPEDRLIFLDLKELQALSGQNSVSFIELRFSLQADEGSPEAVINGYLEELKEKLPETNIVRVKDENLSRQEVVKQFARFAALVGGVVMVIGWLIMASTMMSTVNERFREIGVLRAMGYRKTHIIKIIVLEAGMVSALGGAVGYLLGLGAGSLALAFIFGPESSLAWKPTQLVLVLAMSLLVGLTAAIYPAYRAARLDPVEALRRI